MDWKYDEVTGNVVSEVGHTALRNSRTFTLYYSMLARLLFTAVIPQFLLLFFNVRIVIQLCQPTMQHFRGSELHQRKETNACLVLLFIVVILFVGHTPRIMLNINEYLILDMPPELFQCDTVQMVWKPAFKSVSNVMIVLNSSVNIFVYCLVGNTFRRELYQTLGIERTNITQ